METTECLISHGGNPDPIDING